MKPLNFIKYAVLVGFYTGFCDFNAAAQNIFPAMNQFDAGIKVTVDRNADGKFDYEYEVFNREESKQSIFFIKVYNKGPVGMEYDLPLTWAGFYQPDTSGEFNAFPMALNIFFKNKPPLTSIHPGSSKGGFEFPDHVGPPVITKWVMVGWAPKPKLDEERGVIISGGVEYKISEWADTVMNHSASLPNANPRTNRQQVFTIGPSNPPTDPVALCDTFIVDLIGQVREAVAAGWIKHDQRKDRDDDDDDHGKKKGDEKEKKKGHDKDDDKGNDNGDDDEMDEKDAQLPGVAPSVNRSLVERSGDDALPGIAKSIIKKLTKVRRECMRGKFGSAREKLRALIKQVNAQRGKKLTEEAYALIRFNAEFLLEKI